jgi:carboxyl-terminal processing protease
VKQKRALAQQTELGHIERFARMIGESQQKLTLFSMRLPRRRFLWALSVAAALTTGVFFDQWELNRRMPDPEFRLITDAWDTIQHHYVNHDALKNAELARGAVQGMVESLGDNGHTAFLNPETSRHTDRAMEADFAGIGVQIQITNRQTVIVATMEGSPALKAGLRAGDVITDVNDQSVAGLPLNELEHRIAGPIGQPVKLGVLVPPKTEREDFTVVRGSVKIDYVTWNELPGVGVAHLRLAMFNDGAARDFRKALLEIQQRGIKSVVLDLRNNPGGILEEAVSVASEFLSSGDVLWEKNADGQITTQPVKPGGIATKMPLVVLINGGSASAAEIVAGALSDAHRAKLVGKTTFGTGTVLQKYPLPDGSAILLAVDEWLTPSGKSFWHRGIKPDEEVSLSRDTQPLAPEAESKLTADGLKSSGDVQLLRAIALLKDSPKTLN